MVSKAWKNIRIKLRKLLEDVIFEDICPQLQLYLMDDIILNFEPILEIFNAIVIALHWGQAGPTFGLKKWKLKLPSVEQMKEKLQNGCIHWVEYVILIISTNKSFPSMILVSRFPEWSFGYNVKRIIFKDPSGPVL
jgi:hypothetical protein